MECQQMYALLFNAVTDALAQLDRLDRQNYGTAREILIQAQQKAEALYLEEA